MSPTDQAQGNFHLFMIKCRFEIPDVRIRKSDIPVSGKRLPANQGAQDLAEYGKGLVA